MKTKLFTAALASLIVSGFSANGTSFAEETAGTERTVGQKEESVGQKIDDATLVAKIKADLLRSPEVSGLDVNVDARNGVVTLSGSAATAVERAKAEQIAKTASGVSKVDNKIVIKAEKK